MNGHPLKTGREQTEDQEILTYRPPPSTRRRAFNCTFSGFQVMSEDNIPSMPVRENESSEDDFDQWSDSISGLVGL